MKRLLFIHHVSDIGGASYCLLNIIKNLNRELITPIVLLKNDGPLVLELAKLNVEILFVPSMVVTPYNLSLCNPLCIKNYVELSKALQKFKVFIKEVKGLDAVYCNNLMLSDYVRIAKQSGLKTILHIREHWPLNEHVKQLEHIISNFKFADQIVAINRYSASLVKNSNVKIIYDWIDLDSRYEPVSFNEIFGEDVSEKKILVYTGGIQKIKGPLYVARGFKECIKGDDYRLLMLGIDNAKKEYSLIKRIIRSALIRIGYPIYSHNVMLAIQKDKRIKTIPSKYLIKDIIQKAYCNISYFTIPHANLAQAECVLVGTPTICAETDESLEYSLEGQLSFLFKLGDYDGFCNTLRTFEQEYEKKKNRILADSEIIRGIFDKRKNIDKLNGIIEGVLFQN